MFSEMLARVSETLQGCSHTWSSHRTVSVGPVGGDASSGADRKANNSNKHSLEPCRTETHLSTHTHTVLNLVSLEVLLCQRSPCRPEVLVLKEHRAALDLQLIRVALSLGKGSE